MKKIFGLIIVICIVFSLAGCSSQTKNWQLIEFSDYGTMKIPSEWSCFVQDGIYYIMNGESPVMISYRGRGIGEKESNLYFDDFQYIDFVTSAVLSNGPIYGKAKYQYNNAEIERYYLNLGEKPNGDIELDFIVWDTKVEKDLLIDIAKTFAYFD
jgi:hypothetical protein